jgi:hypothetical protein
MRCNDVNCVDIIVSVAKQCTIFPYKLIRYQSRGEFNWNLYNWKFLQHITTIAAKRALNVAIETIGAW